MKILLLLVLCVTLVFAVEEFGNEFVSKDDIEEDKGNKSLIIKENVDERGENLDEDDAKENVVKFKNEESNEVMAQMKKQRKKVRIRKPVRFKKKRAATKAKPKPVKLNIRDTCRCGKKNDLPTLGKRKREAVDGGTTKIQLGPLFVLADDKTHERIVGGTQANKNEYPWMVAIVDKKGQQFCGGTLINSLYVITAAHCVCPHAKPADIKAYLGDHRLSDKKDTQLQIRRIIKIICHPTYGKGNSDANDIAILKLKSAAEINNIVAPACLPPSGKTFQSTTATVTGWGSVKFNGKYPDVLREVDVNVVSNKYCASQYNGNTDVKITSTMLCAKTLGRDACQGDSGGPLVTRNATTNNYELIGVVSLGIGCASKKFPGVYTRVSQYKAFIRTNTADGVFCRGGSP